MNQSILTTIALGSAVLLSSCLMGPDFKGAKAPELPTTWQNALPKGTEAGNLEQWWKQFRDPQLDKLIQTGIANNPDMINAALAISRAEAVLRSNKADLFPTASVSVGGNNSGNYNTSTSHGGWSGGLSASWTPDIWGGTRREVEASMAQLGSTLAARNATQSALASGIATTYFQWIAAKESLRIAREQLSYQERTFRIVSNHNRVGMNAGLDMAQSRATVASTRASIPALEAAIKNYENALAIYLGTTLNNVSVRMPSYSTLMRAPRIPTNLPADILRRRPDIIKAEADLHAATANIGVSVANLFPRVTLTGSTSGSASTDFANFWKGASWSLAASASQSIFNRVALNENVKIAKIAEQTAGQNYRKTVLAAFSEVEELLITYAQLVNQLPQQQIVLQENKKAAEISLRLYNASETDFLNVASAERSWLSSELTVISTRQQIRMTLARICTAMGGGYPLPQKK